MRFERSFHDAINYVVFADRFSDPDGDIVTGFNPYHWMMFNLKRADPFLKIGSVTEEMDQVSQLQLLVQFQDRYVEVIVIMCDSADLYFHRVIPFLVPLRSGPNS